MSYKDLDNRFKEIVENSPQNSGIFILYLTQ